MTLRSHKSHHSSAQHPAITAIHSERKPTSLPGSGELGTFGPAPAPLLSLGLGPGRCPVSRNSAAGRGGGGRMATRALQPLPTCGPAWVRPRPAVRDPAPAISPACHRLLRGRFSGSAQSVHSSSFGPRCAPEGAPAPCPFLALLWSRSPGPPPASPGPLRPRPSPEDSPRTPGPPAPQRLGSHPLGRLLSAPQRTAALRSGSPAPPPASPRRSHRPTQRVGHLPVRFRSSFLHQPGGRRREGLPALLRGASRPTAPPRGRGRSHRVVRRM